MKTIEELKKDQMYAKDTLVDLIEFINSEEFYSLSAAERNVIYQERAGLELYLSSLAKRIYGSNGEQATNNLIGLSLLYSMFNLGNSFTKTANTNCMEEELQERDFEG